jgi:hypothetical protein
VHVAAAEWAKERAVDLVGMRRQADGTLVANPDARWAITESMREQLRGDVVQAIEDGRSTEALAEELEESYAFSGAGADTIARTEVARADVQGNLAGYAASGLVSGKRWLLGSEHGADDVDECDTPAALGVVPLDDDFGGIGDPPAHPNCVCDVIPALQEDLS